MEILNATESTDSQKEQDSSDMEPSPTSSTPANADKPSANAKANGKADSTPKDDRETVRALLAEARNTKVVLEEFSLAIQNGNFPGRYMMALAKGCSFVDAVLAQNKAHVDNLQARLEKK